MSFTKADLWILTEATQSYEKQDVAVCPSNICWVSQASQGFSEYVQFPPAYILQLRLENYRWRMLLKVKVIFDGMSPSNKKTIKSHVNKSAVIYSV